MDAYWNPATGKAYCADPGCEMYRAPDGAVVPITADDLLDSRDGRPAFCDSCDVALTPDRVPYT